MDPQNDSMTSSMPIQFVWLDANMYSDENSQLLEKIRRMNTETNEFVEKDECERFLGRVVGDPRRFILIVSGALGEELMLKVHNYRNILSVYVYCGWSEKHEKWAKSFSKVKVVTKPEELLQGLKLDRDRFEKD